MNVLHQNTDNAVFNLSDLISYLGEKQACAFSRAYRHAISIVEGEKLRIKCLNLAELVAKFKGETFLNNF